MGRYLKWLPTPKAIHNSYNSSFLAYAIANTTKSVSTLLIKTFLRPLADASLTWMKILVSASSWLQMVRPSVSTGEALSTSTPDVVITSYHSQALCQIVKKLFFVFIRSQTALPVDWNGCIIAHAPSYSRASRLPCTPL